MFVKLTPKVEVRHSKKCRLNVLEAWNLTDAQLWGPDASVVPG